MNGRHVFPGGGCKCGFFKEKAHCNMSDLDNPLYLSTVILHAIDTIVCGSREQQRIHVFHAGWGLGRMN